MIPRNSRCVACPLEAQSSCLIIIILWGYLTKQSYDDTMVATFAEEAGETACHYSSL